MPWTNLITVVTENLQCLINFSSSKNKRAINSINHEWTKNWNMQKYNPQPQGKLSNKHTNQKEETPKKELLIKNRMQITKAQIIAYCSWMCTFFPSVNFANWKIINLLFYIIYFEKRKENYHKQVVNVSNLRLSYSWNDSTTTWTQRKQETKWRIP